ncbi:hypothetical protein Cni_G21012 [Canna indica]|uniref:Uncharacterized protein n=1 Tax=Canna indica TaxID=4628 RepID=A0AAQ3QGT3_9LILI|nr:hypothetical protein Cni_G21012 [Canna indica]
MHSPGRFEMMHQNGTRGGVTSSGRPPTGGLMLAKFMVAMAVAILMALFFHDLSTKAHAKSNLALCAFLAFSTLLSGLSSLFLTLASPIRSMAADIVGHVSAAFLVATVASLTFLIQPENHVHVVFTPIILLPLLILLLCNFFYLGNYAADETAASYDDMIVRLSGQLISSWKLSLSITSLIFAGMLGTISGYSKMSSPEAHSSDVEVCLFFMLLSSYCGLLLLILSLSLPRIDQDPIERMAPLMITISRYLSLSLWALMFITASMVATVVLEGFMIILCFLPVALAAAVWSMMKLDYQAEEATTEGEERGKLISTLIASSAYGGMMTLFSMQLAIQEGGLALKICMFIMFSTFVYGYSLILLSFGSSETRNLMIVVKILTCSALCFLLVMGILMMI